MAGRSHSTRPISNGFMRSAPTGATRLASSRLRPTAVTLRFCSTTASSTSTTSSDDKCRLRPSRASAYQLPEYTLQRQYAPTRGTLEQVYFYAIKPIYTVFPKPGELNNLVSYLLTGETSVSAQGRPEDLQAGRIALNIWQPVWS